MPATAFTPNPLRLVVRVLQDVLRCESFESYADVIEATKCQLAMLRIRLPEEGDLIRDAIEQLERGGERSLVVRTAPRPSQLEPERPVSREQAAALVAQLRVAITPMPAARPMTLRQTERVHAVRSILQALRRQIRVCKERERRGDKS